MSNELEVQEVGLITTLDPKIQRFIHLYLTGQYSIPKIADLIDVHPNTLYNWLKRSEVKSVIEDMQLSTHEVVGTTLKALTLKAVNKLSALVDSPIDGVSLQAVNTILDRAGHKPKQEIKIDKTVRTFEEKLSSIIDKTIPSIDVEFEDVENEVSDE